MLTYVFLGGIFNSDIVRLWQNQFMENPDFHDCLIYIEFGRFSSSPAELLNKFFRISWWRIDFEGLSFSYKKFQNPPKFNN